MNVSDFIVNQAMPYITELLFKTVTTVFATIGHNWLPLSLAIITAVLLKVYIDTDRVSRFLLSRTKVSILASVAVGAFTPFCACGTTAVVLGMLSTTLPWGPVMAFLTSSPLMSPDGFIMMSGMISLRFAIALTVASVVIGLGSGFITYLIERKTHYLDNQNRFTGKKACESCGTAEEDTGCACSEPDKAVASCSCSAPVQAPACGCSGGSTLAAEPESVSRFSQFAKKAKLKELWITFVDLGLKQILLYFSLFVGLGYLINYFVPSSLVTVLFGAKNIFAVPLAALVGLPLYITTESGIPIIKSILASGASEGAMMAFIITGSATSAWVIAGISSFLKKRAIALYVAFILGGGILFGYLYDILFLFIK
jgi:Predicted permeases